MENRILLEHLNNVRDTLVAYSKLISTAEHKVNIGSAREELISSFLKNSLPQFVEYHTGEIFDSIDNRSGQIDLILHPITSPKLNLYGTINMFPAETVLAVIEVKSKLDKDTLIKTLDHCKKVKDLNIVGRNKEEFPIIDPNSVPYIIFTFTSLTPETILNHIKDWKLRQENIYFDKLPDLIVALNNKEKNGFYLLKTKQWMMAAVDLDGLYKIQSQENPLLSIFEFLEEIISYWASNPLNHVMPIKCYCEKDKTSIFNQFF